LAIAVALAAAPAAADQTDSRLKRLFADLNAAPNAETARPIEQAIWGAWSESSEEVVNLLMEQGVFAMSRRDYRAALRSFDQMVVLAPEFAEGWNKRATVHYLLGNYAESLADIAETLKLEPRHFGALSGRGLVYLELEEEALALESFEAALEIYPKAPGANHNAEVMRRRLGDKEI
jgi:tetratricopeptide (TPR) repeat protein